MYRTEPYLKQRSIIIEVLTMNASTSDLKAAAKFVAASKKELSYNYHNKEEFRRTGQALLHQMAALMGYQKDTYDVRWNAGGIAVSGDIIFHSDDLYINLRVSCTGHGKGFYFRTVKSRKDYTGDRNIMMKFDELLDLDNAIKRFRSATHPVFDDI